MSRLPAALTALVLAGSPVAAQTPPTVRPMTVIMTTTVQFSLR